MAQFDNNRFSSAKQEWETPQELFDGLNKRYNFKFDLAADTTNNKCANYFSLCHGDALEFKWKGNCWLNPPYGGAGANRLANWVEKAYNESKTGDCIVTMLIPARTNTRWWHEYCMKATEVLFINGRPKFGGAAYGLPQPLAVVTFSSAKTRAKFGTYNIKDNTIDMPIV